MIEMQSVRFGAFEACRFIYPGDLPDSHHVFKWIDNECKSVICTLT